MAISEKINKAMSEGSWIRKMFETGNQLKMQVGADKVFDFSLGNPVLEPPEAFQEALRNLVLQPPKGLHRYMPNAGHLDVRAKVAKYLHQDTGTTVEADDVIMTCGAGGAINTALKALLDPGDEVVVIAPFFPEYRFYVDNHLGSLVVAQSAENFDLDIEELDRVIGPKTKVLLLNSPNNPTGRIYPEERLAELGELLSKKEKKSGHTITILSDEPYRKIVFDGLKPFPIYNVHPNTILITSHSKDLGLPGERIGFAAISPHHRDRMPLRGAMIFCNRTLGYVNAPALFQRAVADVQDASVPVAIYQELRDVFCRGLERAGLEFIRPEGAFYLFPKTPTPDDIAFVNALQKHYILAVPGSGFGRSGYMRLSFCVTMREVEGALPGLKTATEEFIKKNAA